MADLAELERLTAVKLEAAAKAEAKIAEVREAAKAHSRIIDTVFSIIDGCGALFDEDGNPTNEEGILEGPVVPQGRIAGQHADQPRYFFARAFVDREHWRADPETEQYLLGKQKHDQAMRKDFFRTNGSEFGVRYYFGDEEGKELHFLKTESVPRRPLVGRGYLGAIARYSAEEIVDMHDRDTHTIDHIMGLERTMAALTETQATDEL